MYAAAQLKSADEVIWKRIALEDRVTRAGVKYDELYEKHLTSNKEHNEPVEKIIEFEKSLPEELRAVERGVLGGVELSSSIREGYWSIVGLIDGQMRASSEIFACVQLFYCFSHGFANSEIDTLPASNSKLSYATAPIVTSFRQLFLDLIDSLQVQHCAHFGVSITLCG